ncbi:MAG: L,D-transpeptidase [Anaerolineales bacterium]
MPRPRPLSRLTLLALSVALLTACGAPAAVPPTPSPAAPTASAVPTASPSPPPPPTPTPTPEPPWYQPLDPALGALRYHYAEVTAEAARVYVSLQDAAAASPNFGYLPHYPAYVAYTTTQQLDGRTFYLTNLGWMRGEDLRPLTPSLFTGILLTRPVDFRFGWVLSETHSLTSAGAPVRFYARYQIVHEVRSEAARPGFLAVGPDEWLPEETVALVDPVIPPEASDLCRFIYVNLDEQTLAVYDECTLVFASLVSSGQDPRWTFPGRFWILNKTEYTTVTPPEGSVSEYYIEGLPYFMTYYGDLGFHGVYYHDDLGAPVSHGCINLSPADARWLYDWARLGEYVVLHRAP